MASLLLPPWAHVCFTDEGTIFLNIKDNQYYGLDHLDTSLLRNVLDNPINTDDDSADLIAELVRRGLLTEKRTGARAFAQARIDLPKVSLLDHTIYEKPEITSDHVAKFLSSCIKIWIELRCRSLEHALFRLGARKARIPISMNDSTLKHALKLVGVFRHLRPLFYKADQNCLYDSLTFSEFLRRYNIHTRCIFGVRTLPFGAHCWVQVGSFIAMNGTPEYLASFTPILAV